MNANPPNHDSIVMTSGDRGHAYDRKYQIATANLHAPSGGNPDLRCLWYPEPARHDPEDDERLLVQDDRPAEHVDVTIKMRLPEFVIDDR